MGVCKHATYENTILVKTSCSDPQFIALAAQFTAALLANPAITTPETDLDGFDRDWYIERGIEFAESLIDECAACDKRQVEFAL